MRHCACGRLHGLVGERRLIGRDETADAWQVGVEQCKPLLLLHHRRSLMQRNDDAEAETEQDRRVGGKDGLSGRER